MSDKKQDEQASNESGGKSADDKKATDKIPDEKKSARTAGGRRPSRKTVSPFEPRRRARRRALQALYQWQLNDDSATAIISQFVEEQNFEGVDQNYFETLVREVVANRDELDQAVAPFLKRSDAGIDQMERVVLRLGACELIHHPETPYRVVIDESVELAHRFGAEKAHTFINGVLDRLADKTRTLERNAEQSD